jgi:uncharacterized glyoxalase superfamily protein PhnB
MPPETLPILPSWDFDHTARYYAALGFQEEGRWPGEHLIVRHSLGIELHFFSTAEFPTVHNHHGVYVRFETAAECDALHQAWSKAGVDHLSAPADTDYRLREFSIIDPMGNLLRIGGFITDEP